MKLYILGTWDHNLGNYCSILVSSSEAKGMDAHNTWGHSLNPVAVGWDFMALGAGQLWDSQRVQELTVDMRIPIV